MDLLLGFRPPPAVTYRHGNDNYKKQEHSSHKQGRPDRSDAERRNRSHGAQGENLLIVGMGSVESWFAGKIGWSRPLEPEQ